VIGGLGGWDNLDAHANETILWTCLAFSILSADLVLQWQQLGPSPSAVRRHSPASPERMLEAPWAMFIGHVSILMASLGGGARASKQKQNKAAQDAVEESFTRLTAHCLPSLFVAFPGAMGKR
jgi:hypothetical protein